VRRNLLIDREAETIHWWYAAASATCAASLPTDQFSGGNAYIVSGLKTFLETGVPLAVA